MSKNKLVEGLVKASPVVASIGAINWGLVGLFDMNLVEKLLGTMPMAVKVVYVVVGVAGLVTVVKPLMKK